MAAFQDVVEFVVGTARLQTSEEMQAARGASPSEEAEAELDRMILRARQLFPNAKGGAKC